jgi:hypothetical protein
MEPCSRALATRLASAGWILTEEDAAQGQVPRLELEHALEEADEPRPCVLRGGTFLGGREHLVDVLGVDDLDERIPRREVPVQRADPDARASSDFFERRVRPPFREQGPPRLDQLLAIPLSVPACHTARLAETEGASVLVPAAAATATDHGHEQHEHENQSWHPDA